MKKVKIFLGGYINFTNAQNLNCRSLANYLDKNKFDVYTLELYSGSLPKSNIKGVNIFHCFYPFRISKYLGFLWGVLKSDILYLPKGDPDIFPILLAKVLDKKCFCTVEGVLNDEYLDFCKTVNKDALKPIKYWKRIEYLYPITEYIGRYMHEKFGLNFKKNVLYLGIDTHTFKSVFEQKKRLRNIVMIGNALKEKGVFEYLEIAKQFPNLQFHIVGAGHDLEDHSILKNSPNVTYHGMLNHGQMLKLLKDIDLHILFSRTEGFPKVVIETAAAGIPSIVYSHYGASEWIQHNKNGFVIDNFEESIKIIQNLIKNKELLNKISIESAIMAEQFSWENQIKNWEDTIINILEGE